MPVIIWQIPAWYVNCLFFLVDTRKERNIVNPCLEKPKTTRTLLQMSVHHAYTCLHIPASLLSQSSTPVCSIRLQSSTLSSPRARRIPLEALQPFWLFLLLLNSPFQDCDFSTWPQASDLTPSPQPPPLQPSWLLPRGFSGLEPPEFLHTYPHTYIKWEVAVLLS